jgi:NADH dehydrogenase
MTFVVIGAGPTGVEMAGTMTEIAQHTLPMEFRRIDSTRTRVVLIEGSDRVLGAFVPQLSQRHASSWQARRRRAHRLQGDAIDADGVATKPPGRHARDASPREPAP